MSFPGLLPIESPYQSDLVCPVFSISVNMAKPAPGILSQRQAPVW